MYDMANRVSNKITAAIYDDEALTFFYTAVFSFKTVNAM